MSNIEERSGGCLCGGVSYRAAGPFGPVLQCHCVNCRRLSGNFVAATRISTAGLSIEDPDGAFAWHELGYAKYGFCARCGSTLFYRATDSADITSVMMGSLDDSSGFELGAVWFSEEAQPHNALPDGVPHHIGNG